MRRPRLTTRVLLAASIVACTPSTAPPSSAASLVATATPRFMAVATPPVNGGPGCSPPSQAVALPAGELLPLQGTPTSGQGTRLFLGGAARLLPEQEALKFILRMNGHGTLSSYATQDDGAQIAPLMLRDDHTGSSYDPWFPGTDEWGVFYSFPKSGCWRLHFERTEGAGDFYVVVGTSH